jgi:predicted hydrolase (HD superfamily)
MKKKLIKEIRFMMDRLENPRMTHIEYEKKLNEILKPSQYRPYVKAFNRDRYSDMFKSLGDKYEHDKNFYRIYIPLKEEEKNEPISNTEKEVTEFLNQNNYEMLDYIKGITKFSGSKNTTTIGKILTKLKADELLKKFVSDESRKALTSNTENLMIVISRHPYDIAGSDTDRNWTNCMTISHGGSDRIKKLEDELGSLTNKLETSTKKDEQEKIKNKIKNINDDIKDRKETGVNVQYLIHDVKEGSLISYLIKKDDKNINNPISVLNIKPYVNVRNSDDFILISDNNMYGNGRPEFKSTIDSLLSEINGVDKQGYYCLKKPIYNDSQSGLIKLGNTDDYELSGDKHFNKIMEILKTKLKKDGVKGKSLEYIEYTISKHIKNIIKNILPKIGDFKIVSNYLDGLINIIITQYDFFIKEYKDGKELRSTSLKDRAMYNWLFGSLQELFNNIDNEDKEKYDLSIYDFINNKS